MIEISGKVEIGADEVLITGFTFSGIDQDNARVLALQWGLEELVAALGAALEQLSKATD